MVSSLRRVLTFLIVFALVGAAVHAGGAPEAATGETLGIRVWNEMLYAGEAHHVNNRDDVVTPYVEDRFDFRFEEVLNRSQQPFVERLNQFIATDNLPDIIMADPRNTAQAIATGQFADLTDYIDQMPNYQRWFNQFGEDFWAMYMTEGRVYQLPALVANDSLERYQHDPYAIPGSAWALWAREDILEQAGYSFEPVEAIVERALGEGRRPSIEEFALDPPVDSPAAFRELLRRIHELDLSVGDLPVVPFTSSSWSQFHLGSIFDFGHWTVRPDGSVDGFLGSVDAEEYYRYLWDLYRDGLVDPDWIVQTDEQIQQKVASGRAATGMYVPDMDSAIAALRSIDPDWTIRYIPWPKNNPDYGFFDIRIPGFTRLVVRKEFPEIERLIEYFDWIFSDEGLALMTWGPEESGLWTVNDHGDRVFTDEQLNAYARRGRAAIADGTGTSPANHGLGFYSRAAMASTGWQMRNETANPYWFNRSFDPSVDDLELNRRIVGSTGVNFDGRATYGDFLEKVPAVIDYYWARFQNLDVGRLLTAQSEAEWEREWRDIISNYRHNVGYDEAKAELEEWFAEYGVQ